MANQQVGKPGGVNSGSELAQSRRVTDERFADETFASGPTDLAIAGPKAAFEIDRPNLIGPFRQRQLGMTSNACLARPSTRRTIQFQSPEPTSDSPFARPFPALSLKVCADLLGSPRRMFSAQVSDLSDPIRLQLSGIAAGTSAVVVQSPTPLDHKTPLPLVGSLATDAKNTAQLFHRLFVPEQGLDQTPPLPNGRLNLPRHDRGKPPLLSKKCHPCLVLVSCPPVASERRRR